MKGINLLWVTVVAVVLSGCQEKGDSSTSKIPLFQSHFIGMTRIIQGTNASKLKDVWALPASLQVRKEALDKIATAPFRAWKKVLPSGAQEASQLIRPLLDDLVASESVLEFNGAGADFDSVIAISLNEERSRVWNTNLWQIATKWKLGSPRPLSNETPGWEVKGRIVTMRVLQAKEWLFVGRSRGKLKAINLLAETAAKSGRPIASDAALLDCKADFPSLSQHSALIGTFKLPVSHFVVSPHRDGESLRTEGLFSLERPLNWTFQPWQIPTEFISDPLVSFTVAQGIDSVLKAIPGIADLKLEKMPTQMCSWSQRQGSFQNFWAFPSPNASTNVRRMTPELEKLVKRYIPKPPGSLVYITNKSEVVWQGLPLIIPSLTAKSTKNTDYFLASLFPIASRIKPPPQELLAQIEGRPDLRYYDWEITSDRVGNAKLLYQILDMIHLRTLLGTNAPSVQWTDQASGRLGNSVTEITATSSPKELKLVRKSHIGLTGFEVVTLLRWIDSPAFPLGYEPPPPLRELRERNSRKPGNLPIPPGSPIKTNRP